MFMIYKLYNPKQCGTFDIDQLNVLYRITLGQFTFPFSFLFLGFTSFIFFVHIFTYEKFALLDITGGYWLCLIYES